MLCFIKFNPLADVPTLSCLHMSPYTCFYNICVCICSYTCSHTVCVCTCSYIRSYTVCVTHVSIPATTLSVSARSYTVSAHVPATHTCLFPPQTVKPDLHIPIQIPVFYFKFCHQVDNHFSTFMWNLYMTNNENIFFIILH